MFEAAEAYERDMGRWSKRLAPLFVEFVGIDKGDRVLDVDAARALWRGQLPKRQGLRKSSVSTRPPASWITLVLTIPTLV
jgi:hypothetical protein